ncbi:amino acid/polyamine/organocation transporter (APC superfamily) [Sphingobacterium allocomposti]|uniref:Amino acid/polyamine/organocation transporter (APC superfamily) n=1 Tax=Sphingobacterium allocomposti TaxID=415956 RepID=A0A5S5D4S4_9SPHI|nr:amino acid permease [Sphingobacterium composti Yoo et al. 2007 non Ten et al. 2007]TYP90941.1 amino acid/polyamine/organocation transporter (APC superfamily) [Sphingobacterium composti Yoo et al. 2007 non Ten et al. 2007]HLS95162.1 amino acid permease [Sphingobacterium sp.]
MLYKKSIPQIISESRESGEHTLKRTLSSTGLIALGVGAIIGAGLFSLTGIAAAENAGPAVILSFVIAALACSFAGLCYAEFASMIPVAGSAYTYSYATMGEFVAWIIGWDLVLEYALASATVAVSWSQYFNQLLMIFGISIPEQLLKGPWEGGVINLPAIIIVCLLSLLLMRGTKESSTVNNLLVILKVSVVLIFIVLGWSFIDAANHSPFIPANEGEEMVKSGQLGFWEFLTSDHFGKFGITGILRAAGVLFFAFVGFDAVSTAAQEAKNPKKGMPIGIIGSLVVCTVLYVLFSYVMTGLENYQAFKGDAKPVATAFAKTGYTFLNSALIVTIIAGYTSVILVMLLGQSRVFYSMSKDGLLPKMFSDLSKNQTPWKTNLIFMIFVSVFAGFVPVSDLGHMVSIGTLFAFTLVCVGILVLRKTSPELERPFKTPFVPVIPILGIIVCILLMASLPFESWERLGIWLLIGLVIYFLYGKKHSKIRNAQRKG